jgi:hypothetical protein
MHLTSNLKVKSEVKLPHTLLAGVKGRENIAPTHS